MLLSVVPREKHEHSRLTNSALWWNVTWSNMVCAAIALDTFLNSTMVTSDSRSLHQPITITINHNNRCDYRACFIANGLVYGYSLAFYVRLKPSHRRTHTNRLALAEDVLPQNHWYDRQKTPKRFGVNWRKRSWDHFDGIKLGCSSQRRLHKPSSCSFWPHMKPMFKLFNLIWHHFQVIFRLRS